MYTLGMYKGEWHILTWMAPSVLCLLTNVVPGPVTADNCVEIKKVETLTEEVCPLCVKAAMNHYRRDDEQIP